VQERRQPLVQLRLALLALAQLEPGDVIAVAQQRRRRAQQRLLAPHRIFQQRPPERT
jgi:hypothetical protein